MTEVMVNGPDDVYVERKGRIEWVGDAAEGRSLAPRHEEPLKRTQDRETLSHCNPGPV